MIRWCQANHGYWWVGVRYVAAQDRLLAVHDVTCADNHNARLRIAAACHCRIHDVDQQLPGMRQRASVPTEQQ